MTIPDSVTDIGKGVFSGTPLEDNNTGFVITGKTLTDYQGSDSEITIPSNVVSIGDYAFAGCSNLTSVTIPSSVTSIGNHAFEVCSNLTSLTIPESVTSIGNYAFYGCSNLTSVTIPKSVTIIGAGAFCECINLRNVTIPSSVNYMGLEAFAFCSNLAIVFTGDVPSPSIACGRFTDSDNIAVWYPYRNATWTSSAMDDLNIDKNCTFYTYGTVKSKFVCKMY